MEGQKLKLAPHDYIVFKGGLKIENTSEDNFIEFEFDGKYTISPMVITNQLIQQQKR